MLKIADKWFARETIDDQITLLWEPHVHELLRCNIWHIKGRDRDLLIDTGMGISSLTQAARDLFQNPLSVVMTHAHHDHMGGAHEFDNCQCHPKEADAMATGSGGFPLRWSDWPTGLLEDVGDYDLGGEYVIDALPAAGFDIANFRMRPSAPSDLLSEGDSVDLGDRRFEVLHLPGHSPGSIALWEEKTGTLFSGDAIYDGPLLDELSGSDISQYIQTMERLLNLPATTIHAGHDPSFDGARMKEIATAYLKKRIGTGK